MLTFDLPRELRGQIEREARDAFPRECCGLIEGTGLRALALHPSTNIAPEPDRFAIDPALHIALRRQLRGTGRAVIGCYHSHPNGRPEPSAHDGDADFVWLIAALDAQGRHELVAHRRERGAWHRLALCD